LDIVIGVVIFSHWLIVNTIEGLLIIILLFKLIISFIKEFMNVIAVFGIMFVNTNFIDNKGEAIVVLKYCLKFIDQLALTVNPKIVNSNECLFLI
jgi:hypothetical protein